MRLRQNALVMLQSWDCITPSWRCPYYCFTGLHSRMLPFSVELLVSYESCVLALEWHTPRADREWLILALPIIWSQLLFPDSCGRAFTSAAERKMLASGD